MQSICRMQIGAEHTAIDHRRKRLLQMTDKEDTGLQGHCWAVQTSDDPFRLSMHTGKVSCGCECPSSTPDRRCTPQTTPVISPISPEAWNIDGFSNTKSADPDAPVRDLLNLTSGIVGSSMPLMNCREAASQDIFPLLWPIAWRRGDGTVAVETEGALVVNPRRIEACIMLVNSLAIMMLRQVVVIRLRSSLVSCRGPHI